MLHIISEFNNLNSLNFEALHQNKSTEPFQKHLNINHINPWDKFMYEKKVYQGSDKGIGGMLS